MIRIRVGERWKSGVPASRADALVSEAHDAFGIEVDGVEISGGLLEDHLFPAAASLVEAITALLAGSARSAAVPFADGKVELVLARKGTTVGLSLVSLARPARVLVRDLEVDMEPLAQAAEACAEELLRSLSELDPGAAAVPLARRLGRACRKLKRAVARPGKGPVPSAPGSVHSRPDPMRSGAPALGFDLRDDDGRLAAYDGGEGLHALLAPGHLYLHGPGGEEICAVAGPPFLLLRDLSEASFRLLCALRDGEPYATLPVADGGPTIEVDVGAGTLTVAGRALRCPPEKLARAVFEGALDLAGALQARNPRLASNPYLVALAEEARERLQLSRELAEGHRTAGDTPAPAPGSAPRSAQEGAPLAAGKLRRVALRTLWRVHLPGARSVAAVSGRLWVVGEEGASCVKLSDGSIAARVPPRHADPRSPARTAPTEGSAGGVLHLSTAGPRGPILALHPDGSLTGHGPGGKIRWLRSPCAAHELAPRYAEVPSASGGTLAVALADGRILLGVDLLTGRTVFRLVPPAAARSSINVAGRLAVIAADNGLLYGIDASLGQPVWRVRVGLALSHVTISTGLALAVATSREGPILIAAGASSGEPAFTRPLQLGSVDSMLPVPGGVVVAGVGSGGGELLHVDGQGLVRWRVRPNLGPAAPVLVRAASAIYARGTDGIGRIDKGRLRWTAPCGPGGVPAIARGVLALPGERLQMVDAASGRVVHGEGGPGPPGDLDLPSADHVVATPGGVFAVCDEDGACAAVRLAGALAVV